MLKYYFLHPETFKVCGIHDGRSLWEDHMDKADWIVVKEVGPAMEYCEEAMTLPISDSVIKAVIENLLDRRFPEDTLNAVKKKLQE